MKRYIKSARFEDEQNELTGFTMRYKGLDVFFATNRKRRDDKLAQLVARKLQIPDGGQTKKEILYWLMPASARIKDYGGEEWLDIRGNNFSGYGDKLSDYAAKGIEPIYYLD